MRLCASEGSPPQCPLANSHLYMDIAGLSLLLVGNKSTSTRLVYLPRRRRVKATPSCGVVRTWVLQVSCGECPVACLITTTFPYIFQQGPQVHPEVQSAILSGGVRGTYSDQEKVSSFTPCPVRSTCSFSALPIGESFGDEKMLNLTIHTKSRSTVEPIQLSTSTQLCLRGK
jgi:hypothetical protein